jgi:hypothetical protein
MPNNSNQFEILHEKVLSDTQKIVTHIISFGKRNPVLAVQHLWKENSSQEEWKFGKMAVLTASHLAELNEKGIFILAQKRIEEIKKQIV